MSRFSRIANVFRQERVTDELDEELQFHVDSRARDLMADGLAPDEAYREARRRLGNAGVIRERSREVKLVAGLDAVLRDMRFAIRMLRRDLVVSLAAIASLALAIGGCTAAFALVDALILRPLPVHDPATLVSVGVHEGGERDRTSFNYPLFAHLVEAVRGSAELAAFSYQSPSVATFDAAGGEERVYEQFVSGNGLGMLGVTPALGRVIVPADDDLGGGRAVAVLSHSFWTRRFGRDPHVVGRTFTLGRKTYQIVGVAREGFTGIEPGIDTSFWMPLTSTPERLSLTDPGWHWFKIMGRLGAGHRADEVRGVMQAVLTNFRRERVAMWGDAPRAERERFLGARVVVRSASNGISGLRADYERPLWILAAVVTLVLLLACSNLANLMLARAAAREREMALRLSIGAGRARLMQQMLVEAGADRDGGGGRRRGVRARCGAGHRGAAGTERYARPPRYPLRRPGAGVCGRSRLPWRRWRSVSSRPCGRPARHHSRRSKPRAAVTRRAPGSCGRWSRCSSPSASRCSSSQPFCSRRLPGSRAWIPASWPTA